MTAIWSIGAFAQILDVGTPASYRITKSSDSVEAEPKAVQRKKVYAWETFENHFDQQLRNLDRSQGERLRILMQPTN